MFLYFIFLLQGHGNVDITLRACKTEQYVKEKTDYGARSYLQLFCGWKDHIFITRLL